MSASLLFKSVFEEYKMFRMHSALRFPHYTGLFAEFESEGGYVWTSSAAVVVAADVARDRGGPLSHIGVLVPTLGFFSRRLLRRKGRAY